MTHCPRLNICFSQRILTYYISTYYITTIIHLLSVPALLMLCVCVSSFIISMCELRRRELSETLKVSKKVEKIHQLVVFG